MTDNIRTQRTVTYPDYSNDQTRTAMGDRRGVMTVQQFGLAASEHGTIFIANRGTATTPISFAKTAYDADQPQLVIDVPSGTGIIPVSLDVTLEDAAATDNEVIWSVSDALIGAGTSTAVTPISTKIAAGGAPKTSACTVRRDYTANGTAPSGGYEFFRSTDAFAQEAGTVEGKNLRWSSATAGWAPVVEGTGALVLHVAAATTAPSGFVTAVWFEYTV